MTHDDSKNAGSGTSVILAGRIEIFPSMPLPELNGFGGKAYAAKLKSYPSSNLFAIICTSRVPPRIDSVLSMRNIDNPAVLRLVESGVVPWAGGSMLTRLPIIGRRRHAFFRVWTKVMCL